MPSTYVITGCSGGIGLELVRQLAARGDKIFATVRKRESSATGEDKISSIEGDVTVIEGIDVTDDGAGELLKAALNGVEIDVLVHNAGGINGTRELEGSAIFGDQALDAVSPERMLAAFQLNTLGPLRVQQAIGGQLKSPGGKVMVVSTGMGSIADNGSGGLYAYRCSKAAVNMMSKGMAADLKDKGIAVVAATPSMVLTDFGPGAAALAQMGAITVELSCQGLVKIADALTVETTGRYMCVSKEEGGDPKEYPAGW